MGKKNPKKTDRKGQQPSLSFEQRMKEATGLAQKKLIATEVSTQLNQMIPHLQRLALEGQKNLLTRTAVLEDLVLGLSPTLDKDGLQLLVRDKEDDILGFTVSTKAAEVGDAVRLKLAHKREGDKEFSPLQESMIKRLTRIHNPTNQTTEMFPEVEESLLGAVIGTETITTVEVEEPEFNDKGEKVGTKKIKYEIKAIVEKVMVSAAEVVTRQQLEAQAKESSKAKTAVEAEVGVELNENA